MSKLFNYRPITILSLSLVLGGCFWYYLFYSTISCVIFCIIAGLILSGILVSVIIKKVKLFKRLLCFVLIPFVVGVSVVAGCETFIIKQDVSSGFVEVYGEVEKVSLSDSGNISSVVLKDARIISVYGKTFRLRGDLLVDVSHELGCEEIVIGDSLAIQGSYSHYYKEGNLNKNYKKAKDGQSGKLYQYGNYSIIEGDGFKYSFAKIIKSALYENMDEESAGVAYAMIFGDKSTIDNSMREDFSASGLAHVLAVSGLHVGFIATLFGFLVGLVVRNKYAKTGVMAVILGLYCYLCGFSASVIRASVMCVIMFFANARGEQYDGLSALGFSACVNFVINPLCIFSIGFLLSYTVVFAIFALGTPIRFMLSKIMPMNVASSLSVSLSAWAGSMPLLLYFFGEISFFSIVINMLMLPFVGVVFMGMCMVLMLSWIPCFKFLYAVPNFLYKILNFVVDGVSSLKLMMFESVGSLVAIVFFIIAILLASDYVFHKHKYWFSGLFVLAFLIANFLVAL